MQGNAAAPDALSAAPAVEPSRPAADVRLLSPRPLEVTEARRASSGTCTYRLVSVGEIVALACAGAWSVPRFQRDFVWEDWQMLNLADSLWRGYPWGIVVLWRDPGITKNGARSPLWIVDGQQRVTSLCMLFGRRPSWWARASGLPAAANPPIKTVCFDPRAKISPFVAVAAPALRELPRCYIPLPWLLNPDAVGGRGAADLEALAQRFVPLKRAPGLGAAELRDRLEQAAAIAERQVPVAVLDHALPEVVEAFERLSGGGLRFRRLLLRIAQRAVVRSWQRRG